MERISQDREQIDSILARPARKRAGIMSLRSVDDEGLTDPARRITQPFKCQTPPILSGVFVFELDSS
jgi:hypothetical protein